jgi:hypothetical protein
MKFRKKPIVIEAEQFFPEKKPWPAGVGEGPSVDDLPNPPWMPPRPYRRTFFINTLEGPFVVTPGDWIITGVQGERYPCKPDIFRDTYDEVTP